MEPVTAEEHAAALEIFAAAADEVTKGELRRRTIDAIKAIRQRSGPYAVYAESFDMPGPGYVVSEHLNEAEALTECRRLNRESNSDAGMYAIHRQDHEWVNRCCAYGCDCGECYSRSPDQEDAHHCTERDRGET